MKDKKNGKKFISMRIDGEIFSTSFNMDDSHWNKYKKLCGDLSVNEKARELIIKRHKTYENLKKNADLECRTCAMELKKIILDYIFTRK